MGESARMHDNIRQPIKDLTLAGYVSPEPVGAGSWPLLRGFEAGVRRGQQAAVRMQQLKREGFVPDLIYTHPGWGDALFVKDVFPDTPLLAYCEFYYNMQGQDVGFDPEFPEQPDVAEHVRLQNSIQLHALAVADAAVSPTHWQKSRYPARFRDLIEVVHEGIDTAVARPAPHAFVEIAQRSLRLSRQDEVITFVNRNLEPCRGFHVFMRALPELLKRRPKAHVIIVGGDDVSYGKRLSEGTYRDRYLRELDKRIDRSRVHFVGRVPYGVYLNLLQVSTAHVYLTYPFVLSWSMLEAMSAGCAVIGSRTAPVQEVIREGENGLLVDFFSPEQIVDAVDRVCSHPDRMEAMRVAARQTVVDNYDLTRVCLPRQMALMANLAGGGSSGQVASIR